MPPPTDIAEAMLRAGDRLGPMAGRLAWYADLASTNTLALTQAEHGADEGSVIAAGMQTAGRGRLGRAWVSPPGAGIYASVILRPSMRVVPLMTLASGVAIAEGIAASTGLQTELKWPNDIYAGGRKLGGILAEAAPSHVVIGFGINVLPAALPPEVAARATSIERELGRAVDRGLVLAECLAALWARYQDLEAYRERDVLDAWRARGAASMGKPITWEHDGRVETGRATGIDAAGALLMQTDGGAVRIASGEVRWV
jgi:BirA family biotin operon repressor/biotin-[acetyl-CoA-carboxylase] ligase